MGSLCEAVPSSQGLRATPPPVPKGQPVGAWAPARRGRVGPGAARSGASCALTPGLSPSLQPGQRLAPSPTSLCTRNLRAPSPSSPFSPTAAPQEGPFARPAASSGGPLAPSVPHPSAWPWRAPRGSERAIGGTTMDQPRPRAQPKSAHAPVPRPVPKTGCLASPVFARLSPKCPAVAHGKVQPLADASRQLSRPRSRRAARSKDGGWCVCVWMRTHRGVCTHGDCVCALSGIMCVHTGLCVHMGRVCAHGDCVCVHT